MTSRIICCSLYGLFIVGGLYIAYRLGIRQPRPTKSIVLGIDEYGREVICDDPRLDIEGTLASWREQSIMARRNG